jgi:cytochrome c peroxidase
MTSLRFKLAAGSAVLLGALVFANTPGSQAQEQEGNYGVGIPEVFLPKYLAFRQAQLASSNPDVMRIKLGYVKGLSTSFVAMVGEMAVDLESGAYQVSLSGLTPLQTYTVWLADRSELDVIPPLTETVFKLVTFVAVGSSTLLTGQLGLLLPFDFTIDRVMVAPGILAGGEVLGAGSVNVFQKIFFRRLTLLNESTGAVLFGETTLPPSLFAHVPDLAAETEVGVLNAPVLGFKQLENSSSSSSSNRSVNLDKLISQGAQLFFEERFNGNGRTCGTCHPASNNLTIDANFIKTRPANDPLFVAEFNPALAQLERPKLMRSFGLILENLDGFSSPTTKFVMRGVPHTLGLQVSLRRDTSLPSPPLEMTGWSGDGAPGTGSLRDFAIGAVTQHFTRDLARVEGRDFTLPREHQLDAMEAFQLSLGRDADFNLAKITFNDASVNTGKSLFVNGTGNPSAGGTCAFCHTNAGALSASLQNENRNFNTNVEDRVHPARSIQNFPKDGGFGRTNNGDGTFGNRTFNTASVVEAADTAPFFHNNVVSTVEGVVAFYGGPEFNAPRQPAARFSFDETQIDQIAGFMRGVNTLQNISVARRELAEILANRRDPLAEQNTRLQTAFDETQDAIDVLNEGGLFPSAVTRLTSARSLIANAQFTTDPAQRRSLIQQAITRLDAARNAVATIAP